MEELKLLFATPVYRTNIGVYDIDDYEADLKRSGSDNGYISNNQKYLLRNKKLKEAIDNQIEHYLRYYLRL